MNTKKQKQYNEKEKQKKRSLLVPSVEAGSPATIDADPEFWSKEIAAVSQATFESVDAAIDAIADRVVARMSSPSMNDQETKRFVAELLSSNDEIVATLKEVLHIST